MSFVFQNIDPHPLLRPVSVYHRVHRVVTAAFWRTFHHEGKIRPGWWGLGVHAHPLSLHLPSPVKLQCTLKLSGQTLFHLYPYMYSVVSMCTPRLCCGGRTHSPGGEGGGGSIVLKTQDTALYLYRILFAGNP
jgi:hypothetical protein